MADRTESLILDFSVDLEDSVESINSLTKQSKALRDERNKLNIQSESGKKRAQEINALLDQNTNKIKNNVSALERQRTNIGNYKSALDNVIPGLSSFIDKGASATKTVQGLTLAQKLLLGPIGLLILALTAIIKWLTGSEEGMDKLAIIMAKVGAVVNVVTDRLIQLGGALVKFLSGDFSGGIDGIKNSFSGMGDEMEREIGLAVDLAERLDILDDLNLALRIRLSEQENVIKNLIIQSKNRFLAEEDRMKLLVQAANLEKQLTGERIALRLAELNVIASGIQLRNSEKEAAQQAGETTIEFAKRLASNNSILLADRKEIAEQLEQYNGLLDNQANIQEKIQNQQDAISDKIAENLREAQALADANRRAQNILETSGADPLQGAFDTLLNKEQELDITERFNKRIVDANAEADAEIRKNKQKNADAQIQIQQQIQDQTLHAASDVASGIAGLLNEQGEAYRLAASAQVIISTYASAQKAYEAAFLPIPTVASPALGVAFAAAAILKGTANLLAINGVQFAEGGVVLRGRSHAQGGIPIEAEGNEIILTKGVYNNPYLRSMASRINVAGGGRSFQDGGLVSNSITQPINQQLDLANVIKNIGPFEVSAKEITKIQNRVKVKEKISKR